MEESRMELALSPTLASVTLQNKAIPEAGSVARPRLLSLPPPRHNQACTGSGPSPFSAASLFPFSSLTSKGKIASALRRSIVEQETCKRQCKGMSIPFVSEASRSPSISGYSMPVFGTAASMGQGGGRIQLDCYFYPSHVGLSVVR